MRIILNAIQYKQNSSGIGLMVCNLFQQFIEMNEKYDVKLLVSSDSPEIAYNCKRAMTVRLNFKKSNYIIRNLYEMFFLGYQHCKNSFLITTDSKVPLFLPKSCEVIPIITDLAIFRMGEVYQLTRKIYWKFLYKNVLKKVDRYIAISEFTKKEMVEILNIPEEKIHVIYCSGNKLIEKISDEQKIEYIRNKYHLPQDYILFVGNFNPRKNLSRIIAAFDRLKEKKGIKEKLVIVGENGWKFDKENVFSTIKNKEEIYFTGYVPDEELSAIYMCACVFVFCTLYEGFGIPIIEAQKCGVPVLMSNNSCFEEIGGKGGMYVDCYSIESIAEGIEKILLNNSLREDLIIKGYENVNRFSWRVSAEKLAELLEKK